jgi:menaquinone-9 beta-reductase
LGLLAQLLGGGARRATEAVFFAPGLAGIHLSLPQPALCLSRYVLDEVLAREFRRLGGELRENARWGGSCCSEGMVRATGRRIQPVVRGNRWFGLKVHVRRVTLQADLEMHLQPGGYVGLCQLDGEVNVCGLFRSRTSIPDLAQRWPVMLRGEPGSELQRRLSGAILDERSFCTVAGLGVTPRHFRADQELEVGDALTMIPPVTGNGMSMAFESAELAVEPLVRYSRRELAWPSARAQAAARCDRQFASRLTSAALLHHALFNPAARRVLSLLLRRLPGLFLSLFRRTR